MNSTVVVSPLGQWLQRCLEAFRSHARVVGLFLLVIGGTGAYWTNRIVIHDAHLKAPVGAVPAAFVFLFTAGMLGLICVVGGRGAVDTLCRRGLGWVRYAAFLTVFLVLPAFLAFMWMLHILDELTS